MSVIGARIAFAVLEVNINSSMFDVNNSGDLPLYSLFIDN